MFCVCGHRADNPFSLVHFHGNVLYCDDRKTKFDIEEYGLMSKYDSLWRYVRERGERSFLLTFEEIGTIAGVPIDHSFLKYKSELAEYGYRVGKISMKEQTVAFSRIDPQV